MLENILQLFHLQYFDGGAPGGDGGGDGGAAATGVDAGDAGQNVTTKPTLEELGVPKDKAERYRARKARAPQPAADDEPPADGGEPPEGSQGTQEQAAAASGYNWDDVIKDPGINQRLQETISQRVKGMRSQLDDLTPALELISRQYGVQFDASDLSKTDFKALAKAVTDDDRFYEDKASDMGVDVETAKRIESLEADKRRRDAMEQKQQRDAQVQQHLASLQQQATALKQKYPSFDLSREMQNPAFFRMTSPGGGMSVEDAFWAIHHNELAQARQAQTAQAVASALSKSVQAGRSMPTENGTRARTSTGVSNKLYSQMSAEERRQYKADLKSGRRKY